MLKLALLRPAKSKPNHWGDPVIGCFIALWGVLNSACLSRRPTDKDDLYRRVSGIMSAQFFFPSS